MGYDEGCEQLTIFLEDTWNGIKDKPKPTTEKACDNIRQMIGMADMLGVLSAKFACADYEIHGDLYSKIRTDLILKLAGCRRN